MRNKYSGICYRCGENVPPGEGHFERFRGSWRTQHASCAIKFRGTPDADRAEDTQWRLKRLAEGTGKAAQRARKRLRDQDKENGIA